MKRQSKKNLFMPTAPKPESIFTFVPKELVSSFGWPYDQTFWRNLLKFAMEKQRVDWADELLEHTLPSSTTPSVQASHRKEWVKKWNEITLTLLVEKLEQPNPDIAHLDFLNQMYQPGHVMRVHHDHPLQRLFLTINSRSTTPTAWSAALGNDNSLEWVKNTMLKDVVFPGKQLDIIPTVLSRMPTRAHKLNVRNKDASTRLADLLEHVRTTGTCKASEEAWSTLLSPNVWRSALIHGSEPLWDELMAWEKNAPTSEEINASTLKEARIHGLQQALVSNASMDSCISQESVSRWVAWVEGTERNYQDALDTFTEVEKTWEQQRLQKEAMAKKGQTGWRNDSPQHRQEWWDQAIQRVRLKQHVNSKVDAPSSKVAPSAL
jgi:hypothetical protein